MSRPLPRPSIQLARPAEEEEFGPLALDVVWVSHFGRQGPDGPVFHPGPRPHDVGLSVTAGWLTAEEAARSVGRTPARHGDLVRHARVRELLKRRFYVVANPLPRNHSHCIIVFHDGRLPWDAWTQQNFKGAWV